jgi:SAM-dependent methyltransferase
MPTLSWTPYDEASLGYFETYERLQFSSTHRSFLRFLPAKGARCLDVGAGSGRDAAALARRGYLVTAVEPSNGLRQLAIAAHKAPSIEWIKDALPELASVRAMGTLFDFILLSAVWMHIAPQDRITSLRSLKHLLTPTGSICMTLRLGAPPSNRLAYPISLNELEQQARVCQLQMVYLSRSTRDSLKRDDVRWVKVVLKHLQT